MGGWRGGCSITLANERLGLGSWSKFESFLPMRESRQDRQQAPIRPALALERPVSVFGRPWMSFRVYTKGSHIAAVGLRAVGHRPLRNHSLGEHTSALKN